MIQIILFEGEFEVVEHRCLEPDRLNTALTPKRLGAEHRSRSQAVGHRSIEPKRLNTAL